MPNDVTKVKVLPSGEGENELTKQYPKLSGFLQGLMGSAPDEVGVASVLDEDAQSSRKLQALGAKYGFPIGSILGMLPFGGGIAKAPGVAAGSRTAQKGIVKLPGGNWLSGSVEDAVKGLKRNTLKPSIEELRGTLSQRLIDMNMDPARISALTDNEVLRQAAALPAYKYIPAQNIARSAEDSAVNNWIDSQLVKKYIKNEMATERDPIRLMADAWPEKKAAKLAEVQARIDALAERTRQLAYERGQPEHTLTEMRQLMIPLEKEKALIEATEGLHFSPQSMPRDMGSVWVKREKAGFPKAMGTDPIAQRWEGLSDSALTNRTTGAPFGTGRNTYGETHAELNPKDAWMRTADPSTKVHEVNRDRRSIDAFGSDLGFDHLIDELRNSLNPESGLPKELLLRYQDLPKVTVPQAAERVAQINAWRAAQKREADLLTANNAATVLHKDYPEKGLKWVEMKKASDEMADSVLADALKYEGDQMAHCVGGYCPDVLSGRSRIFSLRDAKGKPHTTIEVNPGKPWNERSGVFYENPELEPPWRDFHNAMLPKGGASPNIQLFPEWLASNQPETFAKYKSVFDPDPPKIKQIKGYKNGKPEDEYLPYVQDFVKSGKWSDVHDLHNTDLVDLQSMQDVPAHLRGGPRFLSQADYDNEVREFIKLKDSGFADGGLVNTGYNPEQIDARAAQLMEELGL